MDTCGHVASSLLLPAEHRVAVLESRAALGSLWHRVFPVALEATSSSTTSCHISLFSGISTLRASPSRSQSAEVLLSLDRFPHRPDAVHGASGASEICQRYVRGWLRYVPECAEPSHEEPAEPSWPRNRYGGWQHSVPWLYQAQATATRGMLWCRVYAEPCVVPALSLAYICPSLCTLWLAASGLSLSGWHFRFCIGLHNETGA